MSKPVHVGGLPSQIAWLGAALRSAAVFARFWRCAALTVFAFNSFRQQRDDLLPFPVSEAARRRVQRARHIISPSSPSLNIKGALLVVVGLSSGIIFLLEKLVVWLRRPN